MSIYKPVFLEQSVTLRPVEIAEAVEDIDGFLTKKLRARLEGRCSQHGWIRPGSVNILARGMGQAEHGRFTADFIFHCKLKALCYTPHANQVVTAQVLKANKMGAYVLVVSDGRVQDAMRVLIPRDLHMGNTEFEELQAGATIRIRVLRSRFQSGDEFIEAVGVYEGAAAEEAVPSPQEKPPGTEAVPGPPPGTEAVEATA